jgi:hypothetical protein
MKPHHISELIAELIATGKLPSEKRKQISEPASTAGDRRRFRRAKARQMKLKLN